MGEYVKWNGHHTKIGTCEALYYTTFEELYVAYRNGELEKAYPDLQGGEPRDFFKPEMYFFRFPWPDEVGRVRQAAHNGQFNRRHTFAVPLDLRVELAHQPIMQHVLIPRDNGVGAERDVVGVYGIHCPADREQYPEDPKGPNRVRINQSSPLNRLKYLTVLFQKIVLVPDTVRSTPEEPLNTVQLQTVVGCPVCGQMCRLSAEEAEALHIWADENPSAVDDFTREAIKTIRAGYAYAAELYPSVDYSRIRPLTRYT